MTLARMLAAAAVRQPEATAIVDGDRRQGYGAWRSEIQALAGGLGAMGLGRDDNGVELRQAFSRHGALQCGFCTAGILISVEHFLAHHARPTADEIRAMLSGHLCRCTGYDGMVRAIAEVAEMRTTERPSP